MKNKVKISFLKNKIVTDIINIRVFNRPMPKIRLIKPFFVLMNNRFMLCQQYILSKIPPKPADPLAPTAFCNKIKKIRQTMPIQIDFNKPLKNFFLLNKNMAVKSGKSNITSSLNVNEIVKSTIESEIRYIFFAEIPFSEKTSLVYKYRDQVKKRIAGIIG